MSSLYVWFHKKIGFCKIYYSKGGRCSILKLISPVNPRNAEIRNPIPKGTCTQLVYTLALKQSLLRYVGAVNYILFAHLDPVGYQTIRLSVNLV